MNDNWVEFEDLPPHPRNTRDRLRPLFLKALQHHIMHPDLKDHQGWTKVYDRAEEFNRSIPRDFCVPGAISFEQIDQDVRDKQKTIKKKAAELMSELSSFSVKRRGGAIYLKHTGRILKLHQTNNWGLVPDESETP